MVLYLTQPSKKQIICFDFEIKNCALPIVLFIRCLPLNWITDNGILINLYIAGPIVYAAGNCGNQSSQEMPGQLSEFWHWHCLNN